MLNLKKAAFNITSKFGILQAHRSLVITISEERQVYETLLKLVLARVNASTSLLKWAKKENNDSLRESINQLYNVNLMWSAVQREFAEQTNEFGVSLKEILQVEIGIDAIKKELKDISEKREKIQKQLADGMKKKNDQLDERELERLIEEEESLQSELDVKTIKAEIFKSKAIKSSLLKVMKSHVQLADKMREIFSTAQLIISDIPEIPTHLKEHTGETIKGNKDYASELSERLNIQKPTNTVFHIDLPLSPTKSPTQVKSPGTLEKTLKFPAFKKTKGRGNDVQLSKNTKSAWEFNDFVFVSNKSPPKEMPPPVPGYRPRSKTNIPKLQHNYDKPYMKRQNGQRKQSGPVYMEYGGDEGDDYIEPNGSYGAPLSQRSSSDSELSRSDYGYNEPWESYMTSWSSTNDILDNHKGSSLPHFYDEPYKVTGCNHNSKLTERNYDDPYESASSSSTDYDVDDYESLLGEEHDSPSKVLENTQFKKSVKNRKPSEYSLTTDLILNPEDKDPNSTYQNATTCYQTLHRQGKKIQSKPDSSNHHIYMMNQKLPKPTPRQQSTGTSPPHKPPVIPTKKISLPLMPPAKYLKKNAPLPKPRPKSNVSTEDVLIANSVFYDKTIKRPSAKQKSISSPVDSPKEFVNVKDMAFQLKDKILPMAGVPSMTQDKLMKSESYPYENAI